MALTAADLDAERAALVDVLRRVGPDAPTLIDGWTAHDVAAHVAATEQMRGVPTFFGRRAVVRYGWRLNDVFAPITSIDRRRFRRHGFEWAIDRLARPSPKLLARSLLLPVSVFEIFVHHEDIRRANDVARRIPVPDFAASIEWLLRYHRKPLGDVGVVVALDDGRVVRSRGDAKSTIAIDGPAAEVVLWLAGRRDTAAVEIAGAVASLERALRI